MNKPLLTPSHIPYTRAFVEPKKMIAQSGEFYQWMDERRSLREFSSDPVPREVIENVIMSASTAPSGAHKQPWTFCCCIRPCNQTGDSKGC